jgi:hypothetical protein
MSSTIDHIRDELISRAKIRHRRERDTADMAEAIRHGSPLPSPVKPRPGKLLPDVPLHKRGFGVMDEDTP